MSETLNRRLSRWTGWAMGRVLSWVNYIDPGLREVNMVDCHKMDERRFELIDEVSALETAFQDMERQIAELQYRLSAVDATRQEERQGRWDAEGKLKDTEKRVAELREALKPLANAKQRNSEIAYCIVTSHSVRQAQEALQEYGGRKFSPVPADKNKL